MCVGVCLPLLKLRYTGTGLDWAHHDIYSYPEEQPSCKYLSIYVFWMIKISPSISDRVYSPGVQGLK